MVKYACSYILLNLKMSPSEILLIWIQRVLSYDTNNGKRRRRKHQYLVAIGNIPPYACVLNKNYNSITRTLICYIPDIYHDFICPSIEEKRAALSYHVYYSIE